MSEADTNRKNAVDYNIFSIFMPAIAVVFAVVTIMIFNAITGYFNAGKERIETESELNRAKAVQVQLQTQGEIQNRRQAEKRASSSPEGQEKPFLPKGQ